jgi:thiamine biosynthesis lipoprotein
VSLYRTDFRAMGSPCALQLHAATRREADAGFAFCREEIDRLERKYTRFRDDSLTSAINASAGSERGVDVDDETAGLLDYAGTAHAQSDGLFDLTSGILRRAWDFKSGRVPSRDVVAALVARVGWHHVQWTQPRFVLPMEGMQIDFGGVVKEYAADRVAQLCRSRGFHHGLVDLGGDLAVVGPHPGGRPWTVGVRDPHDGNRAATTLAVYGGGVATSGDYERGMTVDGVRYGHLLDPRTGWPVQGPASVTVLASHCLIAGTASTVAALAGRAGAQPWLRRVGLPHVGIQPDGRRFEHWPSATPQTAPAPRPA